MCNIACGDRRDKGVEVRARTHCSLHMIKRKSHCMCLCAFFVCFFFVLFASLKFRLNNAIIKIQTFCRRRVDILTHICDKPVHCSLFKLLDYTNLLARLWVHLLYHVMAILYDSLTWFNDVFQWDSRLVRSRFRWKVSGTMKYSQQFCVSSFSDAVHISRFGVCFVHKLEDYGHAHNIHSQRDRHIQTFNIKRFNIIYEHHKNSLYCRGKCACALVQAIIQCSRQ